LQVFDGIQHILANEEPHQDDLQESVFIGNYPADYFNPHSFLTRSSLTQTPDSSIETVKPSFASRTALFSKFTRSEKKPDHDLSNSEPEFAQEPNLHIVTDLESQLLSPNPESSEELFSEPSVAATADADEFASIPGIEETAEGSNSAEADAPNRPEDIKLSASFSLLHVPSKAITPVAKPTLPPASSEPPREQEAPKPEGIEGAQAPSPSNKPALDELAIDESITDETIVVKPTIVEPTITVETTTVDSPIVHRTTAQTLVDETIAADPAVVPTSDSQFVADGAVSKPGEIDHPPPDLFLEQQNEPDFIDRTEDDLYFEAEIAELEEALLGADEAEFTELFELQSDTGATLAPAQQAPSEADFLTAIDAENSSPPAADADANSDADRSIDLPEATANLGPLSAAQAEEQTVGLTEEISTETIRARALSANFKDEQALEKIELADLVELRKIESPLELSSGRQRKWAGLIATSALSLILFTALAGQYFWRYLPLYSQADSLRPYYVVACQWLGCQLPAYANLDAIRSDELAVRTHPTEANALAIAVSFRNGAQFPQAFPIMILSFNGANNEVVALREFAPDEYLGPVLRRFKQMPPNTPVQVTLNIMDPGPFAVNYTLAFRRP
jgi:hypothetical protein